MVVVVVVLSLAAAAGAATFSRGSRSNPIPKNTVAAVPDSKGWKLRVNGTTPNATAAVLRQNMFNERPAAGRQFFMINVTASYVGKGSSEAYEGMTLDALGRSNVAYDFSDDCGVIPGDLETFKKVFSGGSLTGNICFSVRHTDAASLLLLAEPGFSFSDSQLFFRLR
jgi:hypothetical protein